MLSPGDEHCSCEIDRCMHSNMYGCSSDGIRWPKIAALYQPPDRGNNRKRTHGRITILHNVFAFFGSSIIHNTDNGSIRKCAAAFRFPLGT